MEETFHMGMESMMAKQPLEVTNWDSLTQGENAGFIKQTIGTTDTYELLRKAAASIRPTSDR